MRSSTTPPRILCEVLPPSLIAIALFSSFGVAVPRNVVDIENVLPEKWSNPPIHQEQQLPDGLPTAIFYEDFYSPTKQNGPPADADRALNSSGTTFAPIYRPSTVPGATMPTALLTATKPLVITSHVPVTTATLPQPSGSPSPSRASGPPSVPASLVTASSSPIPSSSSSTSSGRGATTQAAQGANPMAVNGGVATMSKPSALCACVLVLSSIFFL
ncbi:MAG: hypothetical protein M1816_002210 [Peltula sp. TS41687]|nr:MAG: hypothetical protein M1816_002210 [Peltula sp. TS41687]